MRYRPWIAVLGIVSFFSLTWLGSSSGPQASAQAPKSTVDASQLDTSQAATVPDFGRDVRPILSDHCFACHGPDENQRQADLRLDIADGVASMIDGDELAASELIRRVVSDDADELMPPPDFHKPLSAEQKRTIERWVVGGAAYQQHWSFVKPHRPEIPADALLHSSTPIDYFINRAARRAGLEPTEIADRRTLLRRVCLDLTGLPPTREQIREFLADDAPGAYERLVDRLLDSHHFGQHVGRYWLDLVRYADTHGLHLDNYREMWPYRDWVIAAFNANMPFDQFLTRQLAGDLLPDATDADLIASGFNRLNVTTNEGGSIYEEVFMRNCVDRTDAFGTIFMGMTTGCAVCHDHKFDPMTMRDYYSLLAYFNSLDGSAMDQNVKDHAPTIAVPSEEQKERLAEHEASLDELRQEMLMPIESVDQAQHAWEQALVQGTQPRIHMLQPADVKSAAGVELKIDDDGTIRLAGEAADKDTTTIIAPFPGKTQWQTLHLEALTESDQQRVGASSNGNVVLTEIKIEMTDSLADGQWIQVPIVHAFADVEQENGPFAISYAIDSKEDESQGWAVAGHEKPGGRNAWFVVPSLLADTDDAQIRVTLAFRSKFAKHQFRSVRFSLTDAAPTVPDNQKVTLGPRHSAGPFAVGSPSRGYGGKFASQQGKFNVDDVFNHDDQDYRWQHRADLAQVEVNPIPGAANGASAVVLHQAIHAPAAQQISLLIGTKDGHVVYLNGKQIGTLRGPRKLNPLSKEYDLQLSKGDNDLYIKVVSHGGPSQLTFAFRSPAIEVPEKLVKLLRLPEHERTDDVRAALQKYYRKVYCLHPDWLALIDHEKGVRKAMEKLRSEMPTTLVWKELAKPRQAYILTRGQYDSPADPVSRATPPFLPTFPPDAPNNRLGLSQWLTLPDHPLTARVAVNRFWQQLFGTGLVRTSEDFGSQGEPPSHPDLLDWLAVDFRENGWDVKRLLKLFVMTDAYRRGVESSETARQIDPENRLLARGSRHRLDGEVLRDQALALSGLLIDRQGGPSVKPPQPDGLWAAVGYSGSNTVRFVGDEGDKVYRRSVYTFWKRTSPPPQMSTFDAPSRESCTARRERTNTPLQALLLMNETQYVLASRQLAMRALQATEPKNDAERIEWLFETVTARLPNRDELSEMQSLLVDMRLYYDQQPALASKLSGASDINEAAWTILASTCLNLDEVVSR